MNAPIVLTVVLSVVVGGLVALVVAILIGRAFNRRASQIPSIDGKLERARHPCYRCGEVEGNEEYMGLHYCFMCRMVIVQTIGAVRHDPPFGFPGSPGYTEFPAKGPPAEEKKEA
jgi:hypothetical protein